MHAPLKSPARNRLVAWLAAFVLLASIGIALLIATRGDARLVQAFPDGSSLVLEEFKVTSGPYQYSYQESPKILRAIAPYLPAFIRNRIGTSSGSIGVGGDGSTNLIAVTILRHATGNPASTPGRLRVSDDEGNTFDACWGSSTIGMQNALVNAWQIRAFPRRSPKLKLELLARAQSGDWTNMATFLVSNPLFARHGQWTPDPLPLTKQDGPLSVTLREFQSGASMSAQRSGRDPATAPRKTRVVFSFAEAGAPSHQWRVQKLVLSDATGNRWFPYLDFVKQDFNWTTNGTVEFFGALWPGEQAWKLNCELSRIAGFEPGETWEVLLPLPAMGTVSKLTNEWQRGEQTVKLVALASPQTDHTGDFKWVAKWWGSNKDKVYALAIKLDPKREGHRLIAVDNAKDSEEKPVKIMEHGSQDSHRQALFFRPEPDASAVRFTFALQRSRFVEFTVRPAWAGDATQQ